MKINFTFIICFLPLFLFASTLFAQTDSLMSIFKKTPKTVQNIQNLIDLTTKISDYNVDSALNCTYQIQKIVLPNTAYELQCKVLIKLGSITKLKGKYTEANSYLNKALEVSEKNKLIASQIISLYQIGDLNRCIGLLDLSLQYLYLSRNLAYKHKVNHQYPQIYDRISSTYFQLADHNYFRFENVEVPNQNDIGKGKKTPADFIKLCKIYADSTIFYAQLSKDIPANLSALNLLGAYYRQEKQYNKAIEYFDKAIELSLQNGIITDVSNFYSNIARTYFELKNYHKSVEYALKGYKIADQLNILAYKSTLAYVLRISYVEMNDFENALKFHIVESESRDSIYSEQNWNQITELDKKYQTKQRKKEIEHQQEMLKLKDTEVFRLNIIIIIMLIVFIVIVGDIVYIQRQKKKIHVQAQKINEQYTNLEKLDHFKELLTHALVHDLKNPLSQILTNTDNPDIRFASNKMLRLIMNLLDVEKYENTKFTLNKEIHSLTEILQMVKKEHSISLNQKNLQLKFHFTDYLITADKEIISRVFDNLLSNAIRFSPLNSTIDIFAEENNVNGIEIGIKNYGQTISTDELPYIFDKYRHFGNNKNSSYRSTGLGLTFCKMAIEAHGQKISVRNEANGVRFSFTLEGEKSNPQKQTIPEKTTETALSHTEISILKPFFHELQNIEVFQISDIHRILNQIPDNTENIVNAKTQIRNAVFASNIELYNHLLRTIIP